MPLRTDKDELFNIFRKKSNCECALIIVKKDSRIYVPLIEMKSTIGSFGDYEDVENKMICSAIFVLTILRFLEIDYDQCTWRGVLAYYKKDLREKACRTRRNTGNIILLEGAILSRTRPSKSIKVSVPWVRELKISIIGNR